MNSSSLSVFLKYAPLFLLAGCATSDSHSFPPHSTGAETLPVDPVETRSYSEIEDLFARDQRALLQSKASFFLQKYPRSSRAPSVENLLGLQSLREKNSTLAIQHFLKALDLNPNYSTPFNQYILYNLASAYFDSKQVNEAEQTVERINLEALDKGTCAKVYYLKANIFENRGLPLEASRQLLTAGKFLPAIDTPETRTSFNLLLNRSLQKISDISSLEKLYREFEDSPAADAVLFHLAQQEISHGNKPSGESYHRLLMSRFPRSTFYAQAMESTAQLKHSEPVEPRAIGVLLPTSGKFAKFGARSLQGIELAAGIFNPDEADSQLTLVVEDSGEDLDQAMKALDRLYSKHHVIAVIGPMLTKGVEQLAQHAQELGLPLISLARHSGPPLDYVFQGGLTQQLQGYEIARYAIQQLGAHRFAIVSPDDKLGAEISNSFWDSVETLGGKVVGFETYPAGQMDFRQTVDKLSGLYYKEARQRELNQLSQERLTKNIQKSNRKTAKFFNLPPIADYDAVFVPDEPKVAGQILPTFAYRDVEGIQFLGTSSWNSPDFLLRIQATGEQAHFVDAFFLESETTPVKNFISKYKATFGQTPSSLEALAYDCAALLRTALAASSKNASRSDIRDQLKKIHDFPGITGVISYKDGHFTRNLSLLKVKNGKFVEVSVRN